MIQDEQLIRKVNAGNHQALRILIERYKHHVFKIVYSVVRDKQEAEDIVQETFIKMVDALPSYQSQGFKTWLSRIALHKAIDLKRKQKRSKEDLTDMEQQDLVGRVGSTEEYVLKMEKQRLVRDSINQMPDKLQKTVWFYYMEGLSYSEIARKLNLEEKAVEMRLYRARKWMKTNWKEEDF